MAFKKQRAPHQSGPEVVIAAVQKAEMDPEHAALDDLLEGDG